MNKNNDEIHINSGDALLPKKPGITVSRKFEEHYVWVRFINEHDPSESQEPTIYLKHNYESSTSGVEKMFVE